MADHLMTTRSTMKHNLYNLLVYMKYRRSMILRCRKPVTLSQATGTVDSLLVILVCMLFQSSKEFRSSAEILQSHARKHTVHREKLRLSLSRCTVWKGARLARSAPFRGGGKSNSGGLGRAEFHRGTQMMRRHGGCMV